MVGIKQSASTSKSRNRRHRDTHFYNEPNPPHLTGKIMVSDKEVELCLSDEAAYDYLLKKSMRSRSTVSIDSSDSSAITSVETLSICTADIESNKEFEQRKLSISELASDRLYRQGIERSERMAILAGKSPTNTQELRHDTTSTIREMYNVNTIELAGDRLYRQAIERNERMVMLAGKSPTDTQELRHDITTVNTIAKSPLNGNLRQKGKRMKNRIKHIRKNASKAIIRSVRSTFDEYCSINYAKIERYPKTVSQGSVSQTKHINLNVDPDNCAKIESYPKPLSQSSVSQTKNINLNVDPDNNKRRRKKCTPQIDGCPAHLKAIEKNEILGSLMKSDHNRQPTLIVVPVARPSSLLSNTNRDSTPSYIQSCKLDQCNHTRSEKRGSDIESDIPHYVSNGVEAYQRLYALSKPKQEKGRKRRNDIALASKKARDKWTHPTGKICKADATRLYYLGIRQLERRRIKASGPSVEYQPHLSFRR